MEAWATISAMDANWLAILSSGSGGAAALLARRLVKLTTPRDLVSVNFGLMFLMLLPAAPFFWHFQFSNRALAIFFLSAVLDALANIFYFYSFERLPAVNAAAVLALSPLFTLVLQPLFRSSSPLNLINILGIGLVVAGLILLAGIQNSKAEDLKKRWMNLVFPLLAAALFGVNVYPTQVLLVNGWTNPYTYYLLRAAVVTLVATVVLRPRLNWINWRATGRITGRLVFVIAQWLLLLAALTRGNPAAVKTLADTSPLFVAAFSGMMLQEKPGGMQILGTGLTVAGMVLTFL